MLQLQFRPIWDEAFLYSLLCYKLMASISTKTCLQPAETFHRTMKKTLLKYQGYPGCLVTPAGRRGPQETHFTPTAACPRPWDHVPEGRASPYGAFQPPELNQLVSALLQVWHKLLCSRSLFATADSHICCINDTLLFLCWKSIVQWCWGDNCCQTKAPAHNGWCKENIILLHF